MWGEVWRTISGAFGWLLARKDAREDRDRSDFQMVTVGYDKLTALLQARVEGLVAEVNEMRLREEATREEWDTDRQAQQKSNERVARMLRQCRSRETIMTHQLETVTRELAEAKAEIKALKKRMDDHDSGEMKGLPQ